MKKYLIEFVIMFVAVVAAFALNNWSDNQRDKNSETKILQELLTGLEGDLADININMMGHEIGNLAVDFWRNQITKPQKRDSINLDTLKAFHHALLRDLVVIQNVSGYESLKSKGLELIQTDSLRSAIISLYEFDYSILQKLEEIYMENQFYESFGKDFNQTISPYLVFNDAGELANLKMPILLSEREKQMFLEKLYRIKENRRFVILQYKSVIANIEKLKLMIQKELDVN